jgi:hypothetical protein
MQKLLTSVAWIAAVFLFVWCGFAAAEDEPGKLFERMKQLSNETTVQVESTGGKQAAKLIATPIFRYSDQPRHIVDASLWAWIHNGRLVAFQKIEALSFPNEQMKWQYCFASFSSDRLDVRWPSADRFQTNRAGVVFQEFPKAPTPAEKEFIRTQQMKQLARRFSATISNRPDGSNPEVMRLLPKPVFIYPQKPATPTLAIFGLTSNGTNPDAYIILQIESKADRQEWTYGVRRMTTGAVQVSLDDNTIWTSEYVDYTPIPKEAWTFFQVSSDESP